MRVCLHLGFVALALPLAFGFGASSEACCRTASLRFRPWHTGLGRYVYRPLLMSSAGPMSGRAGSPCNEQAFDPGVLLPRAAEAKLQRALEKERAKKERERLKMEIAKDRAERAAAKAIREGKPPPKEMAAAAMTGKPTDKTPIQQIGRAHV